MSLAHMASSAKTRLPLHIHCWLSTQGLAVFQEWPCLSHSRDFSNHYSATKDFLTVTFWCLTLMKSVLSPELFLFHDD